MFKIAVAQLKPGVINFEDVQEGMGYYFFTKTETSEIQNGKCMLFYSNISDILFYIFKISDNLLHGTEKSFTMGNLPSIRLWSIKGATLCIFMIETQIPYTYFVLCHFIIKGAKCLFAERSKTVKTADNHNFYQGRHT